MEHSPIKQSVKAKSTSSSVAAEWREGWTKDAGLRERDMSGRRSGGMAEERERWGEEAWSYKSETKGQGSR